MTRGVPESPRTFSRPASPFFGSTEFRGQDLLPPYIGDRRHCQQQNRENNFQFVIQESYAKACGKKVFP